MATTADAKSAERIIKKFVNAKVNPDHVIRHVKAIRKVSSVSEMHKRIAMLSNEQFTTENAIEIARFEKVPGLDNTYEGILTNKLMSMLGSSKMHAHSYSIHMLRMKENKTNFCFTQLILQLNNKTSRIKIQEKTNIDHLGLAATSASIRHSLNPGKPSFESLNNEARRQFAEDGTRDESRTPEEAKEIYEDLPDTFDSVLEVEKFASNTNFELGHIHPYSKGGGNDAENTEYMLKEDNRKIGDRRPSEQELKKAEHDVRDESSFGNSEILEDLIDDTANAFNPFSFRIAQEAVRFAGGHLSSNEKQKTKAMNNLMPAAQEGIRESFQRGIPAVAGELLFGQIGGLAGFAFKDFLNAFNSENQAEKLEHAQSGLLKLGVGGLCCLFPPLGAIAGAGILAKAFFDK